VLSLSIIIQLAFFFVISSCAIWIDQLCNGWIGMMAMHMNLYRGVTIAACILMVPWLGIVRYFFSLEQCGCALTEMSLRAGSPSAGRRSTR
jgi:hypothetical protein